MPYKSRNKRFQIKDISSRRSLFQIEEAKNESSITITPKRNEPCSFKK